MSLTTAKFISNPSHQLFYPVLFFNFLFFYFAFCHFSFSFRNSFHVILPSDSIIHVCAAPAHTCFYINIVIVAVVAGFFLSCWNYLNFFIDLIIIGLLLLFILYSRICTLLPNDFQISVYYLYFVNEKDHQF